MSKRLSWGRPGALWLGSFGGQISVGAVILLAAMAVLVTAMVSYIFYESKWTVKEQQTTTAFQLAEAATERGYWAISQSSSAVNLIPIAGYNFDSAYPDISGGEYAISIGSDATKDIIVTGVGRDSLKKEVREIQIVYTNQGAVSDSMFSAGTNELSGNESVEWGPVYSQTNLAGTSGNNWPRLYSNGTISGWGPSSCSSAPPCTDNIHYWSCSCSPYAPIPQINFNYYKQLAQSEGPAAAGCCSGQHYTTGTCDFKGCQDISGFTGGQPTVYYADGTDINFNAGSGGNFVVGSIILAGSSSINIKGSAGSGSYSASVPPLAWREYGLNSTSWSHYQTFDGGAPPSFPGLSSSYNASSSYPLSNVVVHGLLYDGGDMNLGGAGNTVIHGVLLGATQIGGNGTLTVYYDDSVASNIQQSGKQTYSRKSWKEIQATWPAGLP